MAGDIVLQLRDSRYPGQMEMRLQAAEIIEQYRKDSESDAALIKQLSAEKLELANHIDGCVRVAADALKRAEAERERCAQVAISFGDFPGGSVVKDIRVMCGRVIADKIREGITTPVGNALHPSPVDK